MHHTGIHTKHICNIAADEIYILGVIDCNMLLLAIKTLSISSNKLHTATQLIITFKDKAEPLLVNDGELLIQPYVDESNEAKEDQPSTLSVDQSNDTLSIHHYEITTVNENCKLNIMNIGNAQTDHCKIECHNIHFMNARHVRCSNQSVIECLHTFACYDMDDFALTNQSTLKMEEKETIINVEESFCVDKTSKIDCTSQHVEINSKQEIQLTGKVCIDHANDTVAEHCQLTATRLCIEPCSGSVIRTKHVCDIIADDASIHIDIESETLQLTTNTLSISSNKLHTATQLIITFKDKAEPLLVNDGELLIQPYV
eukprot:334715_1